VRNRARRLRLFAFAFVFLGFFAFHTLSEPWYAAENSTTSVVASLNATQLIQVQPPTQSVVPASLTPTDPGVLNTTPVIPTIHGIISPVVLLLIALALGVLAAWITSTAAAIIGLMVSMYAWYSLVALRKAFVVPSSWSHYTVIQGLGQQRFWFSLTLSLALLGFATVQSYAAHRQERQAHRRAHPNEPTTLIGLLGTLVRNTTSVSEPRVHETSSN
jgi:hypothetical protein